MPDPIYRGFTFPFGKNGATFPAESTDEDLIRASMIQLILTSRGERLMRPSYGANALAYVFENNDGILAENLRTEIQSAVGRFEPRVIIQSIAVSRDIDAGQVLLTIGYIVRATRTQQTIDMTLPAPAP